MSVVKNKNGRGILLAMVHTIQQNKQLLGDVDGQMCIRDSRRRGPRQKSSDRAGRQDVEAGPWNRKGV